jgi:hypothetical protein
VPLDVHVSQVQSQLPALSNLLDHFLEEYFWWPSAIVCYSSGGFGGVRAVTQLRVMLCELGMPSIPSLFPIPKIQDAFGATGEVPDPKAREALRKVCRRTRMVRRRAAYGPRCRCAVLSTRFEQPLECREIFPIGVADSAAHEWRHE